jgi:Rod binding domain-containing protein
VSSINLVTPPVSLTDARGTKAAATLKNSASAGNTDKIQKSAREFEAVLLSHWLEQAEHSFATVPGGDKDEADDPGRDQFTSVAMQAVGTAMSGKRGGLGIAAMVARSLEAKAAKQDQDKTLKTSSLPDSTVSGHGFELAVHKK